MQGIIWNYEQKLLDNFRQTAKGKYRLIYLFENHQQQAEMVELGVRADSQRTEVYKTKSGVSMRTWRAPKSVASQGVFVVIPEISLCDISYTKTKDPRACAPRVFAERNDQPTLRSNLSLSAMIAINSLFVGFPLSF